MSLWFRVAQQEDKAQVFSGEGGLFAAGRWNQKGVKAVYCSQSLALCTLEWLSHHGLSVSGFEFYKFSIEIPDHWILDYGLSDLPKGWKAVPSPDSNRDFAEKNFYAPRRHLAMSVPSVMVPEERNIILNPQHPAFQELLSSILF